MLCYNHPDCYPFILIERNGHKWLSNSVRNGGAVNELRMNCD